MSKVIEVPEGWDEKTLLEIGEVITGSTPATEHGEYYGGFFPFIGPVDVQGQKYITKTEKKVTKIGLLQSREIPKNTILTVCIGSTIGKLAISSQTSCTNQQINSLICSEEFDVDYIYYSMSFFLQKQLDIEAGLQAVPIVNKSTFSKLIIPCPINIKEQQHIAEILSTLDHAIEASEKLITKEKQIKKGLMNDLLTHGIDEHGHIRTPQTHRYKESELGMIPEEWKVKPLEKIISKVMDFRGKTPLKIGMDWGGGLIASLSANNVQMGTIDFDKETHLGSEELYRAWMNKGATQKSDIVFTMEAPLGNVALIPDDNKYILSQRVILVRPSEQVLSHYLYYYLMTDFFQKVLLRYSSGSTVKGIQYSKLKELEIAFPSDPVEQQGIVELLTAQDKKIEMEETNLFKLKELKKGLMDDLLSGSVRVKV